MEVTLQDIARELDVSAMTVSLALRHDSKINPDTRARINEVAHRMGYKARARRPRRAIEPDTKQRSVLGLLVRHSSLDSAQHDTNLMKMMAGMMSVTDEQDMHLKVHTYQSQESGQVGKGPLLRPPVIQEGECQALIAHGEHDERDLAFLANRMPVVSVGRIYRKLPIDAAIADNFEGVHEMVTHLIELGHRRLAWVGTHYASTFLEAREAGFIQGCRKYGVGLDERSFFGPEIYEGHDIRDKGALLAAVEGGVTVFVCGNDLIALEVIDVLEAAGRRVPQDVSVTGFDAWVHPKKVSQTTSIDPRFFEIGRVAARLALQRLAHPTDEPCLVSVRGKLVQGNTAGAPPQTSLIESLVATSTF